MKSSMGNNACVLAVLEISVVNCSWPSRSLRFSRSEICYDESSTNRVVNLLSFEFSSRVKFDGDSTLNLSSMYILLVAKRGRT